MPAIGAEPGMPKAGARFLDVLGKVGCRAVDFRFDAPDGKMEEVGKARVADLVLIELLEPPFCLLLLLQGQRMHGLQEDVNLQIVMLKLLEQCRMHSNPIAQPRGKDTVTSHNGECAGLDENGEAVILRGHGFQEILPEFLEFGFGVVHAPNREYPTHERHRMPVRIAPLGLKGGQGLCIEKCPKLIDTSQEDGRFVADLAGFQDVGPVPVITVEGGAVNEAKEDSVHHARVAEQFQRHARSGPSDLPAERQSKMELIGVIVILRPVDLGVENVGQIPPPLPQHPLPTRSKQQVELGQTGGQSSKKCDHILCRS